VKERTTCFGLYRKAIIRLYIIVELSAVGEGDEISPPTADKSPIMYNLMMAFL
jgi:hypothetical protein